MTIPKPPEGTSWIEYSPKTGHRAYVLNEYYSPGAARGAAEEYGRNALRALRAGDGPSARDWSWHAAHAAMIWRETWRRG